MKPALQVRKNFNKDLGKEVFTVERTDGKDLFPDEGIVSINYDTEDGAHMGVISVLAKLSTKGSK